MLRIGRDDGTFQIQNFQQLLGGQDFVRLLGHADLATVEVYVIGPHINHMQRLHSSRIVMRTSKRFAINRNRLTIKAELQMFDPRRQTVLQLFGVQKAKHASKCVVRRHAMRQFEELFEPSLMSFARAADVGPGKG